MLRRLDLGERSRARLKAAGATVALVLIFALVGWAAGPRWHPVELTTTIEPSTASVSVLGSSPSQTLGRYETTSRIVEIPLTEDVTTQVLIVEPVGLTGLAPAAVFLHGAGTGLAEGFAEHAQALASAGIVALSPAKRLDNYSTTDRDYEAMAEDYAKTVELARSLASVDPDRVGLYAESEGTWTAPVMAAADPDLAFLALVSAPVVTPREQGAFATDAYLRDVGVPQPLLRAIPRATGAHFPFGILGYADFDMLPYLAQVEVPLFMAYGTADKSMPTVQGAQIVMGTVPGGVEQVMVRYYGGANHGIRIGSSSDPVIPDFLAGLAAWMLNPDGAMAAGPLVAGATPVQVHLASAVPQPRWYADGEMLLRVPMISAGTFLLGLILLVVSGLYFGVARARRLRARLVARAEQARTERAARAGGQRPVPDGGEHRGRAGSGARDTAVPREREPGSSSGERGAIYVDPASSDGEVDSEAGDAVAGPPRPAIVSNLTWLSLTTLAVMLVLVVYVASVAQLALSYDTNAFVVWGGWVLLQVLAVSSALSLVLALRSLVRGQRAWRARREELAIAGEPAPLVPRSVRGVALVVGVVGAWSVLAGCTGLLFVAAYWGAFSPLS